MRKILFRGRDHAGKWHEGSLITRIEESPVPETAAPYEVYYIKGQDFAGEENEVDPETIKQLASPATELHPEIWEGDVIEICGNDLTLAQRTVVEWHKHQAGFAVLLTNPSNALLCVERNNEAVRNVRRHAKDEKLRQRNPHI